MPECFIPFEARPPVADTAVRDAWAVAMVLEAQASGTTQGNLRTQSEDTDDPNPGARGR